MKVFYESNEPMSCMEALWYSAGAEEGELVQVKYLDTSLYIECDNDRIHVYNDAENKTLLASLNSGMSIEYLTSIIEHMIYALKH